MHHYHEEDEGSPMLSGHFSKEELITAEGPVPIRRKKANFTKRLTYGIFLTCTVLAIISLSFLLGHRCATRNFDRRCLEHVSMYCKYPVQSSVCKTPFAHALSTRTTRNGPPVEICPIQRDTRASDRVDWGSKPRGRRRVGEMGAWYIFHASKQYETTHLISNC